ncbi:MAG: AEC family transporter [Sphaerochaetaceae bacterium]|nr:AEC family transporter [Sphaerochaetaceae bacterium]
MEIVIISFNAIAPMFIFMIFGYFLKTRGFLPEDVAVKLNKIVFFFFIPVMVICNIYECDLRAAFEPVGVAFCVGTIVASFLISWFVVSKVQKDRTIIPVVVQGIFKCNYVIIGLEVAKVFFGDDVGIMAILIPFVSIVNNILAVYIFEHYSDRPKTQSALKKAGTTTLKMLKNPLIFGTILAILINLSGITIPSMIYKDVLKKIASMTTPLSLLVIGAGFSFKGLKKYSKVLTWTVVARNVIQPLVFIPLAIVCGLSGKAVAAVAVIAAGPNAVNSYSIALQMGGNAELADQIVIMTSLVSMVSLFLSFCVVGWTFGF